jgi:hypothetical protein
VRRTFSQAGGRDTNAILAGAVISCCAKLAEHENNENSIHRKCRFCGAKPTKQCQCHADLQSLNNAGIRYSAYLQDDGKTFVHFVAFKDDEASKQIGTLDSFKHFQSELKARSPEVPPQVANLTLVGSSFELFG